MTTVGAHRPVILPEPLLAAALSPEDLDPGAQLRQLGEERIGPGLTTVAVPMGGLSVGG